MPGDHQAAAEGASSISPTRDALSKVLHVAEVFSPHIDDSSGVRRKRIKESTPIEDEGDRCQFGRRD